MRHFGIFTLLLAMSMMTAWADPVSKKAAQQVAQEFMQRQLNIQGSHRAPRMVKLNTSSSNQEYESLYLFNASDGQGFVVVSGDDRTEPILGYSTSGSIDLDNMPENMRSWLQQYAEQIEYIQKNNIIVHKRTAANCGSSIAPTLTSKWYQKNIYYDQCPMVTSYTDPDCTQPYEYKDEQGNMSTAPARGLTGCVATAMAQVLYQHKYPASTTAEIPGRENIVHKQTSNTGVPIWTMFSDDAIPAGTPFDWDYMVDAYGSYTDKDGKEVKVTTTEEQNNAVAILMHTCGAAMNMKYGPTYSDGSGAESSDATIAAAKYLGYPNASLCIQDFYDYQEWVQMLYDEISVADCTFFGGSGMTGGHAFVIDGYDKEDLFHVNWGWAGNADGYFRINSLTPRHYDFSTGQSFIRGLYAGAPAVEKGLRMVLISSNKDFYTKQGTAFSVRIEIGVLNEKQPSLTAQLGITVEGKGYKQTFPIDNQMHDMPLANPFTAETTLKLSNMKDGEYKCYASYRLNEADEWKPCEGYEESYLELLINGIMMDVIFTKPFTLELVSTLPATSFEVGKDIQFTATAKVATGTLHEGLTIVCMLRDKNNEPVSSFVLPIAMISCYHLEGETFDIPIQIPGLLPEGNYCIAAISPNRVIINKLFDFDITAASAITSPTTHHPSSNTQLYNLAGQRVNKNYKGIVIQNGKRFVNQ